MAIDGANLLIRLRSSTVDVARNSPDAARLGRLRALFYVGVPLALGFVLGWLGVGRTATWPTAIALAYWIGLSLVATWCQDLATRPVAALLRPRGAPLWFVLIAGQLLGGYLLVAPFVDVFLDVLVRWLPAGTHVGGEGTGLATFAKRLPSNVTLWVGLNLLFFYGMRMPRFGYLPPGTAPSHADAPTTPIASAAGETSRAERRAEPSFLSRVRTERRGTHVLALRAEGHYLRVYTDAGSDLVLYRLSDAIAELTDVPGAQVHRSWWIAERALAAERHGDRLRLINGVDVPVSRSYRVGMRQRGWLSA